MEKIIDIFISHRGADSRQANALLELLKARDPKLEIFLDCADERPLDQYNAWKPGMLRAIQHARYLIVIASKPEYLMEGHGYLYEEVDLFTSLKAERAESGRADLHLAWFGILLGGWTPGVELFGDKQNGALYYSLYHGPQHLSLPADIGTDDAAERIWNKVCAMMEGGGSEIAADLLDRVHSFAKKKQEADPMFCPEAICEELLPFLSRGHTKRAQESDPEGEAKQRELPEQEEEERTDQVDFAGLLKLVDRDPVVILGSEGGSGKTSLLTKLFYHHLPSQLEGMIPLYVDAKTLSGKDHLILRHLARVLYGEDVEETSDYTTATIGLLNTEFQEKQEKPRYLLLIDGYNEIPARVQQEFDEELFRFLPGGRYQNVRLLIASRHMPLELPEEVQRLRVNPLTNYQIVQYLRNRSLFNGKLPKKLMQILSTPMYLKLYSQTADQTRIDSKGDLLTAFVRWQQKKDEKAALSKDTRAQAQIFLMHFLPMLAYRVTMETAADSTYVFSKNTLRQLSEEATDLLCSEAYGDYYGDDYWNLLDTSDIEQKPRRKLADLAAEYFVKNSKLLRQEEDGSFLFVHQIYRDFFCAWFVSQELKRSVSAGTASRLLKQRQLPEDIQEFAAELLQEGKPVCSPDTWTWDYRCNERSVLYRLLAQARTAPEGQDREYVANVVGLLKYARGNDLSGCDFSGLDLRGCDLRACVFTRRDGGRSYPASFAGAWLDRENLICDSHFAPIVDGCVGCGRVASVDSSGIIRIRVLPNINGATEKIITDVDPRVRKLLFAPEGDRLYAMTPHEILELPIPEARESVAQPRVLLETPKQLRDIRLDANGQLCFTTAFNAFNPKPVSDPNAPDQRDFYGLNSVAAVNSTGTQVAFGHVADQYNALRIYDYDAEQNEWIEKQYGYYPLLDGFIAQLEQTLKELSLYGYFPDDFAAARLAGESVPAYGSFFEFLRREFYDRNHGHHKAPRSILNRVYKKLFNEKVPLTAQQRQRLEELTDLWSRKLLRAQQENPLLFSIAGRRIESVDYRDAHTLLVSCVNIYDHADKKRKKGPDDQEPDSEQEGDGENAHLRKKQLWVTNTLLVEIDTRTMQTRFVAHYAVTNTRSCPMKASYWEGGILIFSNYLLTVHDFQHQMLARVQIYDTKVTRFLPLPNKNFLAIARHFIYQFDDTCRCVAGWNSAFEPTNCTYVRDAADKESLILTKQLRKCIAGEPVMRLDLATGSYHVLAEPSVTGRKTTEALTMGQRQYKLCAGMLTAFERGIKVDGFAVPYKLFIQGCDFRGLMGTLSNEADLCLLTRYGGITDPVELPVWQTKPEVLHYKVSQTPFRAPEKTLQAPPYGCHPDFSPAPANDYQMLPGGNNQYLHKIWGRLYEDSYTANALETADLSILEWIGRLGFVTPQMVRLLLRAGMVEPPVGYDQTEEALIQRIDRVLHAHYRLLFRTRHGGGEQPGYWYSLSKQFGEPMLRLTGGSFRQPDANSEYAQRRQLIINQWFCRMAAAFPGQLSRIAFFEKFSSECHWFTSVTTHCFLVVGDQPLFLLATRRPFDQRRGSKTKGTLDSLCWLISHYKQLMHNNIPVHLEQPPAVVILGEDYAHCEQMDELLRNVVPSVRKLYTYDALLYGAEGTCPVHFSFQRGQAFAENVLDLI